MVRNKGLINFRKNQSLIAPILKAQNYNNKKYE